MEPRETNTTTKIEVNPNTTTYTTLAVVLGIVAVIGICYAVFGRNNNSQNMMNETPIMETTPEMPAEPTMMPDSTTSIDIKTQ